jgi:hypothetical protein
MWNREGLREEACCASLQARFADGIITCPRQHMTGDPERSRNSDKAYCHHHGWTNRLPREFSDREFKDIAKALRQVQQKFEEIQASKGLRRHRVVSQE